MNQPKYLLLSFLLLLQLTHSQASTSPPISGLTIAPDPPTAPCLQCAPQYTQLCIKLIPNCISYTVQGACTLCQADYLLIEGRCFPENDFSIVGSLVNMQYKVLEVNGAPLPFNIKLAFTENSVGVTGGCNVNSGQMTLDNSGLVSFGPFISTLIFCENDPDPLVVGALTSTVRIVSLPFNKLMLVNLNLEKLMIIEKIEPLESFEGNYTLTIPNLPLQGYQLEATKETFTIKGGCNTHTFTYQATKGPRTIKFGPVLSTRKACLINNDQFFLDAFAKAVAYVRDSAGGFVLIDTNGDSVLRGNTKNPPIFNPKDDLSGKYKITVPGELLLNEIILIASKDQFSLSGGCNTHLFSYEASLLTGSISFGPIASTQIACIIDQDSIFLTKFQNAKKYIKTPNGGFILVGQSDIDIMIIANPHAQIAILPPVIDPPPFSASSEEEQQYEKKIVGTYEIRLPKEGFHQDIRVQFTFTHIKMFGGCNFQTFSYEAFMNGNFSSTHESSTEKACQNDEDQKYINAIIEAISLAPNKQGLLLSNCEGDTAYLKNVEHEQGSVERFHYKLQASFRSYERGFIVRAEDPILVKCDEILKKRYKHFLEDTYILAAFREYYIGYMNYRILYQANDKEDIFKGVMKYDYSDGKLTIRSLVLMDLTILNISDKGCEEMQNDRCKTCYEGYNLFRGRCHIVEDSCLLYDPEECFKCKEGYILEQGHCVKLDECKIEGRCCILAE